MVTKIALVTEKIEDLLELDAASKERSLLQVLLETIACPEDLAATPFQIHNFIMNRKEFCTDWAQMKQAKLEIFNRLVDLNEMSYEYAQKLLNLRRFQRKTEMLDQVEKDTVIRDIEEETVSLEIRHEHFRMAIIKIKAHARFLEATEFLSVYRRYAHLENLPAEEIAKLDENQWRTKSEYFPELSDRYNMTPEGRLSFPHEVGKSKVRYRRQGSLNWNGKK